MNLNMNLDMKLPAAALYLLSPSSNRLMLDISVFIHRHRDVQAETNVTDVSATQRSKDSVEMNLMKSFFVFMNPKELTWTTRAESCGDYEL